MIYKFLTGTLSCLVFIRSFGLYITYDGTPIDTLKKYNAFLKDIKIDARCEEYLNIRDMLTGYTTTQGPAISANIGIFGAHWKDFRFDQTGYSEATLTKLEGLNGKSICDIYAMDARRVLNTDIALERFAPISEDGLAGGIGPINFPIAPPATIDDIKNLNNKFYALSGVLHLRDGAEAMGWEYAQVVKCRPTLNNPETNPVLRFDIDNSANDPLGFTTEGYDSCQPFFLVTSNNEVKTIGTHNPGGNHFSVHSIAYPPTAAFVQDIIDAGVVPEPFSLVTLGVGVTSFIKNRRKRLDKRSPNIKY